MSGKNTVEINGKEALPVYDADGKLRFGIVVDDPDRWVQASNGSWCCPSGLTAEEMALLGGNVTTEQSSAS